MARQPQQSTCSSPVFTAVPRLPLFLSQTCPSGVSWSSVRSWGQTATCLGYAVLRVHLSVEIWGKRASCKGAASLTTSTNKAGWVRDSSNSEVYK